MARDAYRKDTFVSDLAFTILTLLKVGLAIFAIATGIIHVGGLVWLLNALVVIGAFFPVAAEITFIALELTGCMSLGWAWIIPFVIIDLILIANLWKSGSFETT